MHDTCRATLCIVALCIVALNTAANADDFPSAPQGTFSIAVIPDTQHYRGGAANEKPKTANPVTNPVFDSYATWISRNLDEQRIAFVSHVGDIVDVNNQEQWAVARQMMDKLHGRVPYGISVGNHDMVRSGDSSLFQEFFPASRYEKYDWYGGHFKG
ncbi:MAG: metallophosphoesterase, partial [Planctomycetaceae bacterium]|nr:metallophosphoesterase [Planctomycetaceae bacterium]